MPILDEEVRPAEVVTQAADPSSADDSAVNLASAAQVASSPLGLGAAEPMGLAPPTLGEEEFYSIMGVAAPRISAMWSQTLDDDEPPRSALGGIAGRIVSEARKLAGMGIPYRWGQESLSGMDCSGLVQYVYAKMGIKLPRVSYLQARQGKRISVAKLRPGDLVATDNSPRNSGADHIGIYIGGGLVVEAARPGTTVRIASLEGWGQDTWGVRVIT